MSDHISYEESIKKVYKGLILLAVVTLVEVFISLLGKGYVPGLRWVEDYQVALGIVALGLIGLSLYKAYFIIYEFMHMRYEMKGLALSVLLPTVLLIWAVIAFFQEGNAWKSRRQQIQDKNKEQVDKTELEGFIPADTYILKNLG